ncbi:MAG: hypothetical protein H0Z35_08410 [Thermoanaerobacteraceae bacterium]|nr:hypothetical protein [Thermoanaerobacteraceae bacterium]
MLIVGGGWRGKAAAAGSLEGYRDFQIVLPGKRVIILVVEDNWWSRFIVKVYVADAGQSQQFQSGVTYNAKLAL